MIQKEAESRGNVIKNMTHIHDGCLQIRFVRETDAESWENMTYSYVTYLNMMSFVCVILHIMMWSIFLLESCRVIIHMGIYKTQPYVSCKICSIFQNVE